MTTYPSKYHLHASNDTNVPPYWDPLSQPSWPCTSQKTSLTSTQCEFSSAEYLCSLIQRWRRVYSACKMSIQRIIAPLVSRCPRNQSELHTQGMKRQMRFHRHIPLLPRRGWGRGCKSQRSYREECVTCYKSRSEKDVVDDWRDGSIRK